MMDRLHKLRIRNFQSLRDVELQFGMLTVITGATGSGKSAVIRALKHVVFNTRGTGYISRGAKMASVELNGYEPGHPETAWALSLERGAVRGKDRYLVAAPDPEFTDPDPLEFTKLAGGVPDAITQLHRIGEVNFAAQFDRPFLLDDSGQQIARTLGELTNVTLVLDAAREARRRALRLGDELRDREDELAHYREQADSFRGLGPRREAAVAAEAAVESMQEKVRRLTRLNQLIATVERLEGTVAAHQAALPEVPDLAPLQAAWDRLVLFNSLSAAAHNSARAAYAAADKIGTAETVAAAAEAELLRILEEAGHCPVCGQPTARADGPGRERLQPLDGEHRHSA